MILPTLNNNGTSPDDLIQQRHNAYYALQAAAKALQQAVPHSRDYPGKPDQYAADRDAHYARLKTIHIMALDIVGEAVNIKEQIK